MGALWALVIGAGISGCGAGITYISPEKQVAIGREHIEVPSGFQIAPMVENLTAPTAMAFDGDRMLVIAESGAGGDEPHIFAIRRTDGKRIDIYPSERRFPLSPLHPGFHIYGTVGGVAVDHGRIYVSHRDSHDRGVITRFGYDGSHETLIADLPAEGDYGVTNLALSTDGRIYFGIGSASNSGVVGLDNARWIKRHARFCDKPYVPLKLLGYRFTTVNPFATFFESRNADTAGFQPFGVSQSQDISKTIDGKPTSSICSVDVQGGDFRVEAWGYRYPRGLAFNEFGTLYFTSDGMEYRGTRPILNDPDVFVRHAAGSVGPFPDYASNGDSISEARYQPPAADIRRFGYASIAALVDRAASHLSPPDKNLIVGEFHSQSGAAGVDFFPASGPFAKYRGDAAVALFGDRAPFSTGGLKLKGPTGYKLVRVNVLDHRVEELIRNARLLPKSKLGSGAIGLERPIDVKFGPDGAMYILDFGRLEMKGSRERVTGQTGAVYRVWATADPASQPSK